MSACRCSKSLILICDCKFARFILAMRIILCFLFITGALCTDTPAVSLNPHFKHLSDVRHPMYNDGKDWLDARYYIKSKMKYYGIVNIVEQKFTTAIGSYSGSVKQVEGINIIGIVKGIRESGPVIVIGADYDTPLDANPMKNNAGGIACMLETVNLFEDRLRWNPYNLDRTVIFVAFDLNTKEYSTDGTGHSGSYHFVNNWLPEFLEDHKATLGGAIILDSVTTVNYEIDSQYLAPGFDAAFPDAYEKITKNGNKGNFLGLLSSINQTENPVRQEFIDNFHRDRMKRPYYLQEMNLHLSVESATSEVVGLIDHQAHFHFWTYNKDNFPAFLLFDTDQARNEPNKECSLECNANTFLDEDRNRFMTNIVHTLFAVLQNLQMSEYDLPSSSDKSVATPFAGVLILIVAYQIR